MACSKWFHEALQRLPAPKAKESVVVGLSGGVDSAVAAALLRDRGFLVHGVFLKIWSPEAEDRSTSRPAECDEAEQKEAHVVANHLKIHDFNVKDGVSSYWNNVFVPFLKEYEKGLIPNPDLSCNKVIKFDLLRKEASQKGSQYFATGHYATLVSHDDGSKFLAKGTDETKDQSYFLSAVPHASLQDALFPLGRLEKQQTREIAKWLGLPNWSKRSSRGMCFIGKRRMPEFLRQFVEARPGDLRQSDGTPIGEHDGSLHFHSIGQHVPISGAKARSFVLRKELEKDLVGIQRCNLTLCNDPKHPGLFTDQMTCDDLFGRVSAVLHGEGPCEVQVKTGYNHPTQRCIARLSENGQLVLTFPQPVPRTSPGQALVLYQGEVCLGGGYLSAHTDSTQNQCA